MSAEQRLCHEIRGLGPAQARRLAAAGFRCRAEVDDVVRGHPENRRHLAACLGLGLEDLRGLLGYRKWPEVFGAGLTAPRAMGVLAPEKTAVPHRSVKPLRLRQRSVLPDQVSLADRFGPPRDQGPCGTCTAFATVAVLEGQRHNRQLDLAERFLYYWTKTLDDHWDEEGSFLRFAATAAVRFGACREETWPYVADHDRLRQKPPESAIREARQYRGQDAVAVESATDVAEIQAHLAAGRPVTVALPIFHTTFYSLRFHREGRFLMPLGPADEPVGYHALAACGYADDAWLRRHDEPEEPGGGAMLLRNSWGDWAKENALARELGFGAGCALAPFAYLDQFCVEAYTLIVPSPAWVWRNTALGLAARYRAGWQQTRQHVVAAARQRLALSAGAET